MFEVWVAGKQNGTKLSIEVFDTIEEAIVCLGTLLIRVEIYEAGIWDWSK